MISTSTNDTPVEKDTSGAVPAVEMALEQINNQADLLEGYKLEMSAGSPINSEVKNAHGQAWIFARARGCARCDDQCSVTWHQTRVFPF